MDCRLSCAFILFLIIGINGDCMLNFKDDFRSNHPLLLSPHEPKWIDVTSSPKGYATIPRDDTVRLACPSRDNAHKNSFVEFKNLDVISAKCKNGNNFEVNKKTYTFDDLKCEHEVEATDVRTNRECLGKDTELIKVGFIVGSDFIHEYDVCFNKQEQSAVYSEVTIPTTIDKSVTVPREHKWLASVNGLHEGVDVKTSYTCENQKTIFQRILNKDFFGNNKCCVEKGKLVTSEDKVFPAEQAATSNYLNTVPQWSTCNRKNWNEIEKRITNLAISSKHPLTVWTGSYRNMKLAAKWGFSYKDMYLHYVDSSHKALPVPLYIWKVVFDQQSQKAVAIIQINNPHMTLTDIENYVLCEDRCQNVRWLNFLERKNILDGYTYCCDLPDFEHGFHFTISPFPRASGGILRDENARG